jgi:hypothetical protein
MKRFPNSPPRGAIALVSAIVISLLLTAYVLLESSSIIWAREDQIAQSNLLLTRADAYSCGYEAQLAYEEDAANAILFSHKNSSLYNCSIDSISVNDVGDVLIYASASVGTSAVHVKITASTSPPSDFLTSITWRDITSIPP